MGSPAKQAESAGPVAEERAAAAPASAPSQRADSAPPAAAPGAAAARSPMMAKSAASEASLAGAAVRTPEQWIERILELRTQGRDKEAAESYADFRRRYPGYTVAPEVLRKIAPPR